jgi:DNA repair exonuclease SbcCD nuclease subunit
LKILHSADKHANKNYDEFKKSHNQIVKYIKDNNIDLYLDAGDLFDGRMFASNEYNKIIKDFSEIAEYCPVIIVYGTPSHDYKGSLDQLQERKTKYSITVVNQSTIVFIENKVFNLKYSEGIDVIINCLPWPMKSRFLTDEELKLPPTEQDKLYSERFTDWKNESIIMKEKCDCPVILLSHLQLIGAVPGFGQDISSDNHNPKDFYDLCDYGALGHIHTAQNFKHLYYAGSIYNKTWNEIDEKFFNVITIKDNKITDIEKVKLNTAKRLKIEMNYDEYKQFKEDLKVSDLDIDKNIDMWLIINVGNKNVLNYEKEENYWKDICYNIKLDINVIKIENLKRVENYNTGISLFEKFCLYCSQKNIKPTEFQLNKIKELE